MTAFFLLKAICAFLEETLKEYATAQNKLGEYVTPKVFEWYLPFVTAGPDPKIDFPYVAARIVKGQDLEDSMVNVNLYFGVYCKGEEIDGLTKPDGAYDLLNLMEHVRIALNRKGVLDNKFELQKPYEWELSDEQPYPLWVGWASTKWNVAAPLQQLGVDIHGNSW